MNAVRQSLASAISELFLLAAILGAVGFFVVLFLSEVPLPQDARTWTTESGELRSEAAADEPRGRAGAGRPPTGRRARRGGARAQPPGEARQPGLVDRVAVVVDEERREAGLAPKLRFGDQGRPAPSRRDRDDAVDRLRAPGEQRAADRRDRLAEGIRRDQPAALAVHVAHLVPEHPRVLGAHGLDQPADDVAHRRQRRLLLGPLRERARRPGSGAAAAARRTRRRARR